MDIKHLTARLAPAAAASRRLGQERRGKLSPSNINLQLNEQGESLLSGYNSNRMNCLSGLGKSVVEL